MPRMPIGVDAKAAHVTDAEAADMRANDDAHVSTSEAADMTAAKPPPRARATCHSGG